MRRHLRARLPARLAAALLAAVPAAGHAQTVQITNLSDLDFGTLAMNGTDQTRSESVCVTSGLVGGRYSVTASGSGAGGAFTLANGSAVLPYEVQWAQSAGQTSGTNLSAGVMLGGQSAALLNCLLGNTASLVVVVRSARVNAATAGSYNGTLTVLISAN